MSAVAYCGPFRDHSGYGEANRHDIAALNAVGVDVAAQLLTYTRDAADFGKIGELMTKLQQNRPAYGIKILHTTPNEFPRLIEKNKYTVGRFFWETDRVPEQFVEGLNAVDEIWTGSEANREAMIRSGVTKPIIIIPQATETNREWPKPYKLPDFDGYLFYSIFEWTERKNPAALLNAYWREFQNGENVGLLLKTYFRDFTFMNKKMIKDQINQLKLQSGLTEFPPVFLYLELMDREHVMRLHMAGDCFVSAHRGEGWGVPQVEAMLAGKPVISTGYGGVHEYLEDGVDARLLPYEMVTVRGMNHSSFWYRHDQNWAEASPAALREALRWAYGHQDSARKMGAHAASTAAEIFSFEVVGGLMKARIEQIEAEQSK